MKKFFLFLNIIFIYCIFASFTASSSYAASCTYTGSTTPNSGGAFSVTYQGFAAGETIGVYDRLGGTLAQTVGLTLDSLTSPQTVSSNFSVGAGGYSVMVQTRFPITNTKCADIDVGGGGIGAGNLGTINPGTLPIVNGDPTSFVASTIKAGISLLLIAAFIIDLIWTIIAGIRFITAGGDPKTVGQAWSQIYWGLIGMVVVMGSFAIIKLVETFFGVNIISGGITLPTI